MTIDNEQRTAEDELLAVMERSSEEARREAVEQQRREQRELVTRAEAREQQRREELELERGRQEYREAQQREELARIARYEEDTSIQLGRAVRRGNNFPEDRHPYDYSEYEEYNRKPQPLPPLATVISKPGITMPSYGDLQKLKIEGRTRDEAILLKAKKEGKKKELQPKRVKIASSVESLQRDYGITVFYRYVRLPDENIREGKRVYASPKEGACLMVVIMPPTAFKFTFSLCDEDMTFIKDEGRRLCQERYRGARWVMIADVDKNASFLDNIERAYENFAFNINRESTEPKLSYDGIHPHSIRKLYKLVKGRFKSGEIYA